MDFSFILARVVSGLAYGSIYGLFAVSIVLLFRSNRLFNLAQTEIATLLVITMFFLLKKMPYFAAFGITIILASLMGFFMHLGIMRAITARKHVLHSNEVIVTIGLYSIFNSVSTYVFGDEPERFPTPFGDKILTIFGTAVGVHSIVIVVTAISLALLVYLFFRFSRLGLILEAVSESATAARLRGINVSNYLAIAWGLTLILAVIGGILLAPVLFISPNMLVYISSYALISVVIGGLESPFGALLGGIVVGLCESMVTLIPFFGSELKLFAVFILLVGILVFKPRGIWGKEEQRRL